MTHYFFRRLVSPDHWNMESETVITDRNSLKMHF